MVESSDTSSFQVDHLKLVTMALIRILFSSNDTYASHWSYYIEYVIRKINSNFKRTDPYCTEVRCYLLFHRFGTCHRSLVGRPCYYLHTNGRRSCKSFAYPSAILGLNTVMILYSSVGRKSLHIMARSQTSSACKALIFISYRCITHVTCISH